MDDAPPVRRRRPRKGRFGGRGRLRIVFFSIASVWGCVIGAAGLAVGMALSGIRPGLDGPTLAVLAAACVLSVAGAAVASRAYREAVNRRRD